MPLQQKVYLGDGVYVGIDAGYLVLTTENGLEITSRIMLDEDVLAAFIEYLRVVIHVDVSVGG